MNGDGFHTWTPAERRVQLSEFARLCAAIAEAFQPHDRLASAEFLERAEMAETLLRDGWEQGDLNLLGGQFPRGAWWLDPRAPEYNLPRESWQDAVAEWHAEAQSLASDLRAVAIRAD